MMDSTGEDLDLHVLTTAVWGMGQRSSLDEELLYQEAKSLVYLLRLNGHI